MMNSFTSENTDDNNICENEEKAETIKLQEIAGKRCGEYIRYLERQFYSDNPDDRLEAIDFEEKVEEWCCLQSASEPFSFFIADCLLYQLLDLGISPKAIDNVSRQCIDVLRKRFPEHARRQNYANSKSIYAGVFQKSQSYKVYRSFRTCQLGSTKAGHCGAEHMYSVDIDKYLIPSCGLDLPGLRLEVFLRCSREQKKALRAMAWTWVSWNETKIYYEASRRVLSIDLYRSKNNKNAQEPIEILVIDPETIERFEQLKNAAKCTYGDNIDDRYIFESTTEGLIMAIRKLSARAGYPKNYFSAHSIKISGYMATILKGCLDDGKDIRDVMMNSHEEANWRNRYNPARYARGEELAKIPTWIENGKKYDGLTANDAHSDLDDLGLVPRAHRTRIACRNDPKTEGIRDIVHRLLRFLQEISDTDCNLDEERQCHKGNNIANMHAAHIAARQLDQINEEDQNQMAEDEDEDEGVRVNIPRLRLVARKGPVPKLRYTGIVTREHMGHNGNASIPKRLRREQEDSSSSRVSVPRLRLVNREKSGTEPISASIEDEGNNGIRIKPPVLKYARREGSNDEESNLPKYSSVHGQRCEMIAEALFRRIDHTRVTSEDRRTWAKPTQKLIPDSRNTKAPKFTLHVSWIDALKALYSSCIAENPEGGDKAGVKRMMTYIVKVMIHMGFFYQLEFDDIGDVSVPDFIIERLKLPPSNSKEELDPDITNEGNTRKRNLGSLALRGCEIQETKPRKKLDLPRHCNTEQIKKTYFNRRDKGLRSIIHIPDRHWIDIWPMNTQLEKDGERGVISSIDYNGYNDPKYNVSFTVGDGTKKVWYKHNVVKKMRSKPKESGPVHVSVCNFDIWFPVHVDQGQSTSPVMASIIQFRILEDTEEYLLEFDDDDEKEWIDGRLVERFIGRKASNLF